MINGKLKNSFKEIERGYLDIINQKDHENEETEMMNYAKRRSLTSKR